MLQTEARGDNPAQAKNIALNQGRKVALKLFADKNKIKITDQELSKIPSNALEKCLQIASIHKEEQFPHYYRAEVTYKQSFTQTFDIIAKYVPRLANLSPKQIYLFPIFKRNKKCHYENTQWHKTWTSISEELKKNKITLLRKDDEIAKRLLKGENYIHISKALQMSANKIIATATGEFSFLQDGQVFFDVHYRILTKNSDITQNQQLSFKENETQELLMNKAIQDFFNLIQQFSLENTKARTNG